ncbi:MAG: hypothetical protein ACKV2T_26725 [Kofleriaceae bacterium]
MKVAPAKKTSAKGTAKAKPATKKSVAKKPAPKAKTKTTSKTKANTKAKTKAKAKATNARPAKASASGVKKWLDFVEKHGVVLASAKGPVPSLAEQIAGEPIIGSWWSHAKGKEIFEVLSAVDEDVDVRCFKLVDGKVTFVHRRVWPALVRLARDGVFAAARVESVHQEHTETGEHRNFNVPFPEWVPEDVAQAADAMSTDTARAELGTWTASA